jgi:hypothetical protein
VTAAGRSGPLTRPRDLKKVCEPIRENWMGGRSYERLDYNPIPNPTCTLPKRCEIAP